MEAGPRLLVPRSDEAAHRQRQVPHRGAWTPRTRSTSSTPRAPPASPRPSCTCTAATWSASTARSRTSSTCERRTAGGARPTPAGSPATPTSSTVRLLMGATSFMYEGAPTYPYPNRWWSLVETLRHQRALHRAHGHPRPHALRRVLAQPPRSLRPAPAGLGGRAHQPRGLEVVPPRHRQGALPHHGHLVADRDRHVHDHADALRAAQARQRHPCPTSARRPRSWTSTASPWPTARRAILLLTQALAGHAADHLQGPRPVREPVLEHAIPASTPPATRPSATRTATSGSSAAWTTSSRSPATGWARLRSRAPW